MHKDLLDSIKGTLILSLCKTWSECFDFCLNPEYLTIQRRYNLQSVRSYKNLKQRRTSNIHYDLYKLEDRQNHINF